MTVLEQMLGRSAAVVAVRDQVGRLLAHAAGPAHRLPPLLILGETGTGKGLLAGAVHRAGPRAAGPFVDVNCAAIPETLLEAELFGFERGAFTDARQAKAGLFQAAHGGTIFLDEVGLLPLGLQAKLLKAIEERSVRRLGSTRSEAIDVAVIAATSEDLATALKEGRFRADLYHRLAVITLVLPPLRERGEDVVLLAAHFLDRIARDYGMPSRGLGEDAKAALRAYPWPGNVRELANVLERAALLTAETPLTAASLALGPAPTSAARVPSRESAERGETADPQERQMLLDTLRATGWNFTRAAARLGLPRNTLRYRVERLGLVPDDATTRRRGGRPPAEPRRPGVPASTELGAASGEPGGATSSTPAHGGPTALAPRGSEAARRAGTGEGARPIPGEPALASAPVPPTPAVPVPTPPAREVRRVTLVVVRSQPAADAGAWAASRAIEESTAKLRSFGGRIEDIGEREVLASFGVEPEEDPPRQAGAAALAVRRLAGQQADGASTLTVALHTDAVGVTRTAEGEYLDRDGLERARVALNQALAHAEPGTIIATAGAGRFLARRFELAPRPRSAPATSTTYEVVRPAELARTGFVGRERELALLEERFELAESGRGQVVLIVGEPGIGKSRLIQEFRRRLGRRATWVEGHALAFGRAMPFHPVIDMLRHVFRIEDTDPEALIIDKLDHAIARVGTDMAPALPLMRYLLGVDPGDPAVLTMEPRRRHAAILTATGRLLERGTELRPHVLVVEDMHWCDTGTEEWITRLADGAAGKKLLLIGTCRPGYRPPVGAASLHTTLALATLSGEESVQIAAGLLGVDELPGELRALVLDKAEGNPFFIEELVRSMEEQGAVQRSGEGVTVIAALPRFALPDTVQDVLRARMHRLEPRLREFLEVAAVIGRVVAFPLLQSVTGKPEGELASELRQLQAAEFLYETRVLRRLDAAGVPSLLVVPEVQLTFKHALTQEVAYAGIDADRRRALHARIVDAILDRAGDRLTDQIERLAYHALRAERWADAVRFLRQAGAKAFDRSANREAVASWEQALEALARVPESREMQETAIDVRLALRSALLQLGEIRRIAGHLREAETIATALGDRGRLAWVSTYMTIAHLFGGNPVEAERVGERACALADEGGDVGLRATARTPLAHACRERGELHRAVALYREAIGWLVGDLLRERLGQGMPPALYARSMCATCLTELGGFSDAVALATESATLARAQDLPFGLALAHLALGHAALLQGRLGDAIRELDATLELIVARGIPTWFPWAAALKGYALALAGDATAGVPLLRQALERAEALPFLSGHSQWMAWLAHARLLAGAVDEARVTADEALRLSRQRGELGYEAWALHIAGDIEAARGPDGVRRADALQRQALALAAELGLRPLVARCHRALAAVAEAMGTPGVAEHHALASKLSAELGLSLPTGSAGSESGAPHRA